MADWDLLLTDARIATMQGGAADYGTIENGAIAIADGSIAWVGAAADLANQTAKQTRSIAGQWMTPALIDCHTHLVFGGDRSAEFEQRLRGASYEEIARAGGGILSTVRATREANADELFESAHTRLDLLARDGVATVEIKSGYGLDVENEIKMLQESFAFSAEQVSRIFAAAEAKRIAVKLHADQLSDGGGAKLAADFGALSADHLEYASHAGVQALGEVGTAAVLLPGAFLTLGETQAPPVDELRECGVPIAIATDCNPGTSPLCSVLEAMALACRLFKLTPEECLAGTTREAASALGLDGDRGTLEVGKRADIAIWDVTHPRDLSYWLGVRPLSRLLIAGLDVSLT
jgi:imidazolonepropionase